MSIVVNKRNNSRVTLTPSNLGSTAITIKKDTGGTLQSLSNVDSSNLADGFTLLYDAETNKWVASAVTAVVASVDGGSY